VGHFNVISEDFVVSNLEIFYSCAFTFNLFQISDPFSGVTGGLDDIIQFGRVTWPNYTGILQVAGGSSAMASSSNASSFVHGSRCLRMD
jgi:hypothetical protein